jgi:hypothetical protein
MDRASEIEAENATPARFLAVIALNRYTMLLWVPAVVFGVVGLVPYAAPSSIDSMLGALLQFLGEAVNFPDVATLGSLDGDSRAVGAKAAFLVSIVAILAGLSLDLAQFVKSAGNRPPFRSRKRIESIAELSIVFCVGAYLFYRGAISEPVDPAIATDVVAVFAVVAIKIFMVGAFVLFFSRRFYRLLPRAPAAMSRQH